MTYLNQMYDKSSGDRIGPFTVPDGAEVSRHDELSLSLSVESEKLSRLIGRYMTGLTVRSLSLRIDDVHAYGVESWPVSSTVDGRVVYRDANYILPDGRKTMYDPSLKQFFPRKTDRESMTARLVLPRDHSTLRISARKPSPNFKLDFSLSGASIELRAHDDIVIPGYPLLKEQVTSEHGLVIDDVRLQTDIHTRAVDQSDKKIHSFRTIIHKF